MNWKETKRRLALIGLKNFKSEEHFTNWRQWENDDTILEKKIKTILYEDNILLQQKTRYETSISSIQKFPQKSPQKKTEKALSSVP